MEDISGGAWVKGVAAQLQWEQMALPGESEAETVARVLLRIAGEYVDQKTKAAGTPGEFSGRFKAIVSALKKQIESEG